jgi:pentose-5-phosphate-3-epimerase
MRYFLINHGCRFSALKKYGGINNETAVLCKEAGVDMVVSGSYVCKSDNYNERIDKLR